METMSAMGTVMKEDRERAQDAMDQHIDHLSSNLQAETERNEKDMLMLLEEERLRSKVGIRFHYSVSAECS